MELKIYSDGASRGNPGPSALAYIILNQEGNLLKEYSEYIGIGTNNQAEYKALISSLKSAINFSNRAVCYLDSEFVVKQMNGEYDVKDPKIKTLWRQVVVLKEHFQKISFTHVSREERQMRQVDQLANQVLDNIDLTPSENEQNRQQKQLTDF